MLYIGILNLFQHVLSIENRFEILIREYINFRLKKKPKKIYKIIFIFDSIYKSHVFYKLQCKKKNNNNYNKFNNLKNNKESCRTFIIFIWCIISYLYKYTYVTTNMKQSKCPSVLRSTYIKKEKQHLKYSQYYLHLKYLSN